MIWAAAWSAASGICLTDVKSNQCALLYFSFSWCCLVRVKLVNNFDCSSPLARQDRAYRQTPPLWKWCWWLSLLFLALPHQRGHMPSPLPHTQQIHSRGYSDTLVFKNVVDERWLKMSNSNRHTLYSLQLWFLLIIFSDDQNQDGWPLCQL